MGYEKRAKASTILRTSLRCNREIYLWTARIRNSILKHSGSKTQHDEG